MNSQLKGLIAAFIAAILGVAAAYFVSFKIGYVLGVAGFVPGVAAGFAARWGTHKSGVGTGILAVIVSGSVVLATEVALVNFGMYGTQDDLLMHILAAVGISALGAFTVGRGGGLLDAMTSMFTANSTNVSRDSLEDWRGTVACPSCASMQTEPHPDDEVNTVERMICNHCGHPWHLNDT